MDDYFSNWLFEQNITCPNCGGDWNDYLWDEIQIVDTGLSNRLTFSCAQVCDDPEWTMDLTVTFKII